MQCFTVHYNAVKLLYSEVLWYFTVHYFGTVLYTTMTVYNTPLDTAQYTTSFSTLLWYCTVHHYYTVQYTTMVPQISMCCTMHCILQVIMHCIMYVLMYCTLYFTTYCTMHFTMYCTAHCTVLNQIANCTIYCAI